MAFQIKDDLLDYSEDEIGKPKRNDIVERKVTLPLLWLCNMLKNQKPDFIKLMKKKKKSSEVQRIVDFVSANNGISHAKEVMLDYASMAKNDLLEIAKPSSTKSLFQLIDFITHRSK